MIKRITPLALYLASIVLIVFTIFGSHGLLRLQAINRESNSLEKKERSLKDEIGRKKIELNAIKDDSSALERRARNDLGMSREDEILYLPKRK